MFCISEIINKNLTINSSFGNCVFCDIIILIELQGEMFRICRVFVAFVFCAFCVGGVYAANTNSGPTRTVNASGIETGYSGAQSGGGMNDKLCVGKKNGDSCSDNTKTGTCKIQKNNGKNDLSGVRKT